MTELVPVEREDLLVYSDELVAWSHERDYALAEAQSVQAIPEDDSVAFERAAFALNKLKAVEKSLESKRKEITGKIDAMKKSIMEQARELLGKVSSEAERIKAMCNEYATRQAEKREAAERARREAIAMAAIEEEVIKETLGENVVVAKPDIPDAVAAPKSANAKMVETYKFEIMDSELVPRELCSPDEKKIRAFIQMKKAMKVKAEAINIPGVRTYREVRVDSK